MLHLSTIATPLDTRRAATTLATVLLLCGCASYPERTREAFDAFRGGHFERAMERYADPDMTGSMFLSGAEAGTVALAAGDWEAALDYLHRAARDVEEIEERALVSASSLAEGLSSWALNDTSLPYRGEGFERVYVHCGLAMAYLAMGKLQDVWVEVRRANKLLESEEELYEKEYRAGGLGHFLSAIAYELDGRYDEAYIDYRRMAEKKVGELLAGRALVRLARVLGRDDELAHWEELYGADLERPPGAASIIVLAGVGTGPFKEGTSIYIPTYDGLIPFTVPGYERRPQPVRDLRLCLGSGDVVRTDVLESVSDVAEENLSDRLAWMAAKSAVRGVAKRQLTKELEDQWDLGGRILGDLFAVATERPDLRAWQTLPDSWQAARMFVPPGVHELRLEAVGGEAVDLGAYELEEGETMMVLARTIDTRLYAHAIGGMPVAPILP